MSETKHTPGPWHISDQTERDGLPSVLIHAPPEGLLAIVRVGHQGGYYGDANARLIASAPDMLEALKQAMETLKAFDPGDPATETGWKHDELCDAWVSCRAAIAKATGGAS